MNKICADASEITFPEQIETELKQRVAHYLQQKHLLVDYYRIRRRLAYPLPVSSINLPEIPVPGIAVYPWATWMTWELEERVGSLGWTAHLWDDEAAKKAVSIDLLNLANWPQYRQYPMLDLSLGHAARILANAYRQWNWLDDALRSAIAAALRRIIDDARPLLETHLGHFAGVDDILAKPNPHMVLANIPTIGALSVAMAANAIEAPEKESFNNYLHNAVLALFAMREKGFSEGVAYDGYVLDFIMDWLAFLPKEERNALMQHPQFARYLDESLYLGAPGDVVQVAELGDVEPLEMPFPISAQAKAFAWQPLPERAWYLKQCSIDVLRADALAALHLSAEPIAQVQKQPALRAQNAHYALTLRSGWQEEDVAVAMVASPSPMGHMHCNNGSITIGTRGEWFIATPGYQQYLPNSEREFTLGVASRNTPAINGQAQTRKLPQAVSLRTEDRLQTAEMDLTQCYPEELALQSVRRRVQLVEDRLVIVADTLTGENVTEIAYSWHGHPDAAWWIEEGWARLYLEEKTLWVHSPQMEMTGQNLERLRGSRGQLTLATKKLLSAASPTTIRWFFVFGDAHPRESALFRQFCE